MTSARFIFHWRQVISTTSKILQVGKARHLLQRAMIVGLCALEIN
jgi:hypothetical protein